MKRAVCAMMLLLVLCVLCSGCDTWTSGEYLSVTPHDAVEAEVYSDRVIEVTSYTQLRNAVERLVQNGANDGIISISAFNKGTIHFYVDTAISNVIENTAFGSYAVEEITYEIGTNRGVSVAAFKIHYRDNYRQPSQIKQIGGAQELTDMVMNALESMDDTVLVQMEQYERIDVEKIIQEQAALYPDRIVKIPSVTINAYPEKGPQRIVEIFFVYDTERLALQQMRSKVKEAFQAAEASVEGQTDAAMVYEQLYLHLTEGFQLRDTSSRTPAYRVLVVREGDDRSLAEVYRRACERAGFGCEIVTGTRDGQNRTWNSVQIRGKYYYVDLVRCLENQAFLFLTDQELKEYIAD